MTRNLQPWTWGPCDVHLGNANYQSGNPGADFLGFSANGPKVVWEHSYKQVDVDLAASTPFDEGYGGRTATVSLDLADWNMATYLRIRNPANPFAAGDTAGTILPGDYGTLMQTEGKTYPLWLRSTRRADPSYAGQQLGLRFFSAVLKEDGWGQLGVKPRRLSLVFLCLPLLNLGTTNNYGWAGFNFYDSDLSALSSVPVAGYPFTSSLLDILPAVQKMVVAATALDSTRVIISTLGPEEVIHYGADKDVIIQVLGETPVADVDAGEGRFGDRRTRVLRFAIRTRAYLDTTQGDTDRLLNPGVGHLALEESVYSAVAYLAPTDGAGLDMTATPMPGPITQPMREKTNPSRDGNWIYSTFDVSYEYTRKLDVSKQ